MVLGVILLIGGLLNSSNSSNNNLADSPENIEEPSNTGNTSSYSKSYRKGSTKIQGNYIELKNPKITVKENNETFNVQSVSINAENTLSTHSEIATMTLELRKGQLPSLRDRKTSWSNRGERTSVFESKRYEQPPTVSNKQTFSLEAGNDLKYLEKTCYNATIVLRELKGLPSQGMYGNPKNFYVAGIKSGRVCLQGENTGFVIETKEISSRALKGGDIPEGFSGYGEVSDNSSIAERTYTALYLESESERGDVSLDRSYDGKDAKIEEFLSNMNNESRADLIAEAKANRSYTRVDSSEAGGKAWVGGDVELSENQMTGGDTRVNMTLVMQKGKYAGWLEIRMTDYYTQDTQKVMESALDNMKISYREEELRQALGNYHPS